MTSLATGLDTTAVPCLATIQNQVYYTNGYNQVKVWDGISASLANAGITGPAAAIGAPTSTAAGNCTLGVHGIRYRYCNSRTGYVSNPSLTTTVTIAAANNALTYNINTAAVPIITSSDTKCDLILIEMTPVNSATYYQVAQVANTAGTSYVVSISDANLIQGINSDALYGSVQNGDIFSHETPPYGQVILSYKGRGWIFAPLTYALSAATFTNGSTSVTSLSTTFSQAWVGMAIIKSGDSTAYYIASGSGTSLTLNVAYGGSSTTSAATVYSTTPNRGYYSRTFAPEEYYKSKFARDFLQNRPDILTSAIGRREALYIFGRTSSERLIYNDDPSATTSTISPIQGNRGNWNQRTLVEAEGKLFAWDRLGIYVVGDIPQPISQPIDDSLRELMDYTKFSQYHGIYDPVERILMFFFVASGDSYPKYAACMEIDSGRWFYHTYLQGITASSMSMTSDGQVRAMLGDQNGYTWFAGVAGSYDGVYPSNPTVLTATGTPTTASVDVTPATLVTSPSLAGVMCYNADSGESALISGNTSSTLSFSPVWTNAPAAGDTLYLGPIFFEYRTKWWVAPDQAAKKAPIYCYIKLFPGSSTGTMRVYVYSDFSSSPTSVTALAGYDKWPDGVTVTNGRNYVEIAMDGGSDAAGFLKIPMQGIFRRAIQVRVTSNRPDGALRISEIVIDTAGEMGNKTEPV